jgi:hypothetical protein
MFVRPFKENFADGDVSALMDQLSRQKFTQL